MASNVTLTPAQSARILGVIFDSTLSMSDDHQSSYLLDQFINLASYLFAIFEGLETLSTFPLHACAHHRNLSRSLQT